MTGASAQHQVSALLDGEIESGNLDAILSQLEQDAELRASWGRYHLIRGALRRESASIDYRRLADRVAQQIDLEPTLDTFGATQEPAPLVAVASGTPRLGTLADARSAHHRPRMQWWHLAGASALAGLAALGTVTLLREPIAAGQPSLAAVAEAITLDSATSSPQAVLPSTSRDLHPDVGPRRSGSRQINDWTASQPMLEARLNRLLVDHQEHASAASIKGFLPYATLVGYGTQP